MKKKGLLLISIILIVTLLTGVCLFFALYPYKYSKLVKEYCKQFNLNSEVVFSLINEESSFKADAISGAGAMGLMQILPSTAGEVANNLQIENFTPNMLLTPEINIRIGCYYLNYLLNMFDGDLTLSLCAYNAGFNTVKGWLNEKGELYEIKYPETAKYVAKIKRGMWVYKHIY